MPTSAPTSGKKGTHVAISSEDAVAVPVGTRVKKDTAPLNARAEIK
jgi:hypothetical protein